MDYVVGSVAALITGNVTPNRPRLKKRALTPTKHQPSPNVTPKSEFVEDRSIFLSPSMQKKKAIVKKSPKRIFQNPDMDATDDGDGNLSVTSPKADKVKKHLKDDLDNDTFVKKNPTESKSPKNKGKNKRESTPEEISKDESGCVPSENTPKKKKKKSISENQDLSTTQSDISSLPKSPKKIKQKRKSVKDDESNKENDEKEEEIQTPNITVKSPTRQKKDSNNTESIQTNKEATIENVNITPSKKKNRKRKKKLAQQTSEIKSTDNLEETNNVIVENNQETPKKKKKKSKKSKAQNKSEPMETDQPASENEEDDNTNTKENNKSKLQVNPNAVTDKESDSEHESDNEIESENEEINKKVFESEPLVDESSDEDEENKKEKSQEQKEEKKEKKVNKEKSEIDTEDEIKRTVFVGNVPFSNKCKKEVKKIFNKHGQIETIRIRTVPVKDGRYTPKLAVIKNELHPERTTVNVYIKFKELDSVEKAIAENNTVLNDHHLRVSRSSDTGSEYDPKCAIFVGNLPFALEDEVLRQKFVNCGEVESVRIIRDKKTNAGKGFGYVNFASKDGVELALALTEEDLTIKNRIIRVKRCTLLTNKQKQLPDNKGKKQFNQKLQGDQRGPPGFQRGPQGGHRGPPGGHRGPPGGHRGPPGGQRGPPGGQRDNQTFQKGGNRGFQKGGAYGGPRVGNKDDEGRDGAHRRIMNKRKNQDGNSDGPPNKIQKNISQPNKEKKTRKEFVGMTAEKKKKRKFGKGEKKKKALSEILTK